MEDAIASIKRGPDPMTGGSEIEIRPVFEAEDLDAAFAPKLREQKERIRTEENLPILDNYYVRVKTFA